MPSAEIGTIRITQQKLLDNIPKDLFSKFGSLTELALRRNGITSVEKNSFDSCADTLKVLSLNGNLLKTLAEGVIPYRFFNNNHTSRKEITFYNNPWHCSCDLNHLKKLMLEFPSLFPDEIRCKTPEDLRGKIVKQIDLCYKRIDCRFKHNLLLAAISKSMGISLDSRDDCLLTLNSSVNNYYLIWFEKTTTTNPQCVTLKKERVSIKLHIIGESKPQNIYIFCIMVKPGKTVSPIDCITYRILFTRKHQTIWLSQNMQITVLTTVLIAFCLVSSVAAAIVIVLSRIYTRSKQTNDLRTILTKR